ncbi:MAG: hypothetical protein FWF68_09555 [Spirochaetes bacterium]|nr:hypothetical protein [Spirochaetota bacterium]
MQKKLILALLMIALAAGGAFAQLGLSVGGGGLFDLSARNGVKTKIGNDDVYEGFRNMSIGGFIFFDVTYAELNVSFAYGSISSVYVGLDGEKFVNGQNGNDTKLSAMQFGFSLLGKYPINMGKLTIFPLFGVDYNIVLSVKNDGHSIDNPGYNNQFGLLAGIGGDINLTKSLFFRMEGLFHLRLPTKNYNDAKDLAVKGGADKKEINTTWGMGPQIKLALGFRF